MADEPSILAVNAGSSTVKCAAFAEAEPPRRVLTATLDRGYADRFRVTVRDAHGSGDEWTFAGASGRGSAERALVERLASRCGGVAAVGHRIVHPGSRLDDHTPITPESLAELRRARPLDPTHLPAQLALVEACTAAFPAAAQIACLDTAFHRDLPEAARILPIPRRYRDAGYRRLGFHGLSYEHLMGELRRRARREPRVVLAHLGSGSSLAAVRSGAPVDTTMGFTPVAGLVMATRPGDLDPGLIAHLQARADLPAGGLEALLNHECGLLALSGTSGDMRALLAGRADDPRAALAVEVFCRSVRKGIAAMAAALEGIDLVVFSGGIGERSPEVRAMILERLGWLGIELDPAANDAGAELITAARSRVTALVIPTDEEAVIASIAARLAAATSLKGHP